MIKAPPATQADWKLSKYPPGSHGCAWEQLVAVADDVHRGCARTDDDPKEDNRVREDGFVFHCAQKLDEPGQTSRVARHRLGPVAKRSVCAMAINVHVWRAG